MTQIVQATAQQIVDVVPLVMRVIRARLHERRAAYIRVPQFRTMLYINRYPDASLSDLADHIGIGLPSMSKLIDSLVEHKLVSRGTYRGDRRKISLCLTRRGKDELNATYVCTQKFLMDKLSCLPEEDLKTTFRAMQILHSLFAVNQEEQPTLRAEK